MAIAWSWWSYLCDGMVGISLYMEGVRGRKLGSPHFSPVPQGEEACLSAQNDNGLRLLGYGGVSPSPQSSPLVGGGF